MDVLAFGLFIIGASIGSHILWVRVREEKKPTRGFFAFLWLFSALSVVPWLIRPAFAAAVGFPPSATLVATLHLGILVASISGVYYLFCMGVSVHSPMRVIVCRLARAGENGLTERECLSLLPPDLVSSRVPDIESRGMIRIEDGRCRLHAGGRRVLRVIGVIRWALAMDKEAG